MTAFKVFISSTRLDLEPFRQEVRDKLVQLHQIPFAMEDFGSYPADAVVVSGDQVKECDLFIGIYAYRFGYAPDGEGGASVTEQEYDIARELGKRCLCYVAEESLKPETSDEEEWKQQRLAEFKQRVDRELVRDTFQSPEDLREKIGDDVNKLLLGCPLGFSLDDVLGRWRERERETRAHLWTEELNEPSLTVTSPLESLWDEFLRATPWHESVASLLNELLVETETLKREGIESQALSDLAARAKAIDTNGDYVVMLEELKELASKESGDAIQEIIVRLNQDKKEEPDRWTQRSKYLSWLLKTTYGIRDALRSLERKAGQREFARLLPVIGGLGAGKTHFLASLMDERHILPAGVPVEYLLLPLDRSSQAEPLDELILRHVRRMTGMQWRSLNEFNDFLEDPLQRPGAEPEERKIKLVVALDDFQKGLFSRGEFGEDKDELIRFISQHTKLHALHWLLLLQDTSYAEVANADQKWFWKQFSFAGLQADESSRIGEWFVLDRLNYEMETGIEIIKKSLENKPDEYAFVVETTGENERTLEQLSSPFIAWILIELREKVPIKTVVDLNFIEFVTEFWKGRRADLDTTTLDADPTRSGPLLDLAIGLLAASLVKRPASPTVSGVLDDMTGVAAEIESELQDRYKSESALQILRRGNLLEIEGVPEPKIGGYPVERLSVRFETFWEWHLARVLSAGKGLTARDEAAAKAELAEWFSTARSQGTKEGVLTFLILLLDQSVKEEKLGQSFVEGLMRFALAPGDLPRAAVWFAGPKGGPALQTLLAQLAREQTHEGAGGHDLFAFMYFIAECLPDALGFPERLKLLQPHFSVIHENFLTDYYMFIVERLFGQSENEVILASMPYFSGCEVMGITQRLAEATVDNATDGEQVVLNLVVQYLKDNLAQIKDEYETREKPEGERRYFYWEWVVCIFCRFAVEERGLNAYDLFVENNWYKPASLGLDHPVALRMRQEANLALGFWYRTHWKKSDRQRYFDLVNGLVESPDPVERETAFFFIRHTKTYEADRAFAADAVFHPALRLLFLDPEMGEIVEQYRETFRISLEDYEALNQQRENP